jgi:two-component system chemotaxis response regulator CheB
MSEASPSSELRAIAIGASTGAVEALLRILPTLPASFPQALLLVVHLPPEADSTLAALLDGRCEIQVKEAEDKEPLRPGTAYMAPPNYHLLVEPDLTLSLSSDDPVHFSRPSVDVLFESAADALGDAATGIVLTGASADGAAGLRAICAAGGGAVVQDPELAEAATMPRAALAACPSARVLTLEKIAETLRNEAIRKPR